MGSRRWFTKTVEEGIAAQVVIWTKGADNHLARAHALIEPIAASVPDGKAHARMALKTDKHKPGRSRHTVRCTAPTLPKVSAAALVAGI